MKRVRLLISLGFRRLADVESNCFQYFTASFWVSERLVILANYKADVISIRFTPRTQRHGNVIKAGTSMAKGVQSGDILVITISSIIDPFP